MSFSGLWKRTKRRLGAVNSLEPWFLKNHWCAWRCYTLALVRSDADAECPPDHTSFATLSVHVCSTSSYSVARTVRPGRPAGPLKDNCPVTDALHGGRQAAAVGGRACPSLHHGQRVREQETIWAEEAKGCGGDCAAAPPRKEGAESILRRHPRP